MLALGLAGWRIVSVICSSRESSHRSPSLATRHSAPAFRFTRQSDVRGAQRATLCTCSGQPLLVPVALYSTLGWVLPTLPTSFRSVCPLAPFQHGSGVLQVLEVRPASSPHTAHRLAAHQRSAASPPLSHNLTLLAPPCLTLPCPALSVSLCAGQSHVRQAGDAHPDGGFGRGRQDHHSVQAEAGRGGDYHTHHRLQRGDRRVQEHQLHSVGRRRTGQGRSTHSTQSAHYEGACK